MDNTNEMQRHAIEREVDDLLDRAWESARVFSTYTAEQVREIALAVGEAGREKAAFYAEWAVRETGRGNVADNVTKNLSCATALMERYRPADFMEPVIDEKKKIIAFPKPAGVIAALVPSTNPVMTVYYKAMISIMTRNAIIFSPHPGAGECATHAADFLSAVAEGAGAPAGTIQTPRLLGIASLDALMRSPRVSVILATGGPNRMRAAYESGNPAMGMGPGNAPCFVHESADIAHAAEQIVASNSFDHALPCVCESVVLADRAIHARLEAGLRAAFGYFVTGEEERRLRRYLFSIEGTPNPDAAGKSAPWIAEQVGFSVPEDTKSLIVEIDAVGPNEPISREKLFPVLGYTVVDGTQSAIDGALAMLASAGKGHSAVIHSRDPAVVARYTAALPVCRISVNTGGIEGASGFSTNLTRAPLIGTGFFGASSVDDNIGPQYLIQWSRAAYPVDAKISPEEMARGIGGMGDA